MEFIRGIHNLKPHHRGCVLTIGNFDGFHRGHQSLITQLLIESRNRHLRSMIMIFEPHPQEYYFGRKNRLTSLRDKLKYFNDVKVDMVLCISFNKKFANMLACDFITDFLFNKLDVRLVCVGNDFRFGINQEGNYTLLKKIGKDVGFEVISIITCIEKGKRISSSLVRNALMKDKLTDAEILLGHPYRISGRIVSGNALGRIIGFPTVNIALKGRNLPINGVYAVKVYGIIKNKSLFGLANAGICPTFNGVDQRFEIYLLDVIKDLYGIYIEVIICNKVRNEQQFCSIRELKYQILRDIKHVRNYFNI